MLRTFQDFSLKFLVKFFSWILRWSHRQGRGSGQWHSGKGNVSKVRCGGRTVGDLLFERNATTNGILFFSRRNSIRITKYNPATRKGNKNEFLGKVDKDFSFSQLANKVDFAECVARSADSNGKDSVDDVVDFLRTLAWTLNMLKVAQKASQRPTANGQRAISDNNKCFFSQQPLWKCSSSISVTSSSVISVFFLPRNSRKIEIQNS